MSTGNLQPGGIAFETWVVGTSSCTNDKDWLLLLGESAESSTGLIVTMADGNFAESSPVDGKFPGNIGSGETHEA